VYLGGAGMGGAKRRWYEKTGIHWENELIIKA